MAVAGRGNLADLGAVVQVAAVLQHYRAVLQGPESEESVAEECAAAEHYAVELALPLDSVALRLEVSGAQDRRAKLSSLQC